jgi:branched-chain amino acid transport system substrate-binding protein
MKTRWRIAALVCALLALLLALPAGGGPARGVLKIALHVYRTGPFAPGGSGVAGGLEDYFALTNVKGGVEGYQIEWEECEFAYDTARGVECYERHKANMPFVIPLSTGLTYALLERSERDQIPLLTMGYGRSDATDGRTFPWVFFGPAANYWSQAASWIRYLAAREGGEDKLRGKKIALLHLDIPYGREPIPMFQRLAARFGFEFRNFPLPMPGIEQSAAWVDIARRYQADYVFQWNWGASCTVPFTEMSKVGFSVERFLGVWWCGSEEDVRPAGKLAVGYVAANFHGAGRNYPVVREILEKVHGAGRGNIETARVGTVFYNRGVIHGIVLVEAMRNALRKYGPPLTGKKMRDALETLEITEARTRELGAWRFVPPFKHTPDYHGGISGMFVQRWDGAEWKVLPGYWNPYEELVWQVVREQAAEYRRQRGR